MLKYRRRLAQKRTTMIALAQFVLAPSLFLLAVSASADGPPGARAVAVPVMLTIPRIQRPIRIDGVIDPEEWRGAAQADSFWQWSPKQGAAATERTRAFLAYDAENLYIAFEADDSSAALVRAGISRREDIGEDDLVWVGLDTFNDQRRAYEFIANPYGVQMDAFMTSTSWDLSFDAVWSSAGRRTEKGYSVEMAIPFKSLRFPRGTSPQTWGLQLHRVIRRKDEHATWAPYFTDRGSSFSQMGRAQAIELPPGGRHLDILPELTRAYVYPGQWTGKAGVSLQYRPTPNGAFNATYRPDFSQVELDPVRLIVNQRFPVFIPEKRSFFLERADVFSTSLNLLHTRTIVDPQFGAKWTSKEGGTTFGVLSADDAAPLGNKAYVNAVRIQQDILSGSTLGVLYADRELGSSYNRIGGIDGRVRFGKIYTTSFQYAYTSKRDAAGKISQAPGLTVGFNRNTRNNFVGISYRDLGKEMVADTGFLPRVDVRTPSIYYSHTFRPETDRLTAWGPSASFSRTYDHARILTDENSSISLDGGNPTMSGSLSYAPRNLERFSGRDYRKNSMNAYFSAAPNAYWTTSLSLGYGDELHYSSPVELGRSWSARASFSLRPWSRLKLSPSYLKSRLSGTGGAILSDQDTWRCRADLQWTMGLSTRIIADYTRASDVGSDDRTWIASALASYIWHPGTAVHLGYDVTQTRSGAARYRKTAETGFLKLSYLLSL